ncbi:tetratricopeptide repeat protein [Saccharopolyspora erythraea]|uniref:NB-ARC domain-containing protein n=1 Tax=Saccharopolyspora erythraea TaxID=1836 RepID=UPI001BA88419|nr:NB-ARC domain-containing protein [Saccharopolyspora erythraea]QUH00066.1 tetratricopeptide repeat protein [Saccharopolyspora erythraea]
MGNEGHRNENRGEVRNLVQAGVVHEVHYHGDGGSDGWSRPREVPAHPDELVDRLIEKALLDRLLGGWGEDERALCVGISGLSGVGKSALAIYWVRGVSSRFADGQIYYDLHAQGRRVTVVDVVRHCLRALGVPEERIPADEGSAISMLRTKAHGRRLAVLIDNVADPDELVRLRLAAPGMLMLFTTHRDVSHLEFDGVAPVALSALEHGHALELLAKACGAARIESEPEAADKLVELCGRLPAALRVAGALLAKGRGMRPSRLVGRLANDDVRVDRLADKVLAFAVGELPSSEASLYGLLGRIPGPSFSVEAVAALAGVDDYEAEELLQELQSSNLLEVDDHGHFRFHDLVRAHARTLDVPDEEAALLRFVEWYRTMGAFADRKVMEPSRLRVGGDEHLVEGRNPFDGRDALEWLERERPNIVALVGLCVERDWHQAAIALCDGPLWALHNQHKNYADMLDSLEHAVRAANVLGDAVAEARMRSIRARLRMELAEFDDAHADAVTAIALAERSGHRRILASALEFRGRIFLEQQEWREAIELCERARLINEELGKARGMALQEHFIGQAYAGLGDHEQALRYLHTALERFADFPDDRRTPTRIRVSIAKVQRALGRQEAARGLLRAVIEDMRAREVSFDLAQPLELLADSEESHGDAEAAEGHRREALAIYERSHHPAAERVRERLVRE